MPNGLAKVVDALNKRFGANMIRLGSEALISIPRVPTGSLTLDWALGGGYPVGRVGEFYGYESTCKTLMALNLAKNFQLVFPDMKIAWIDSEGSWDVEWARRVGVDVENVWLSQPDTGNQAFDIIDQMVRSSEISLVVLDSLGMTPAQQEVENSMEKTKPAVKARMVNEGCRKLQAAMNFSARAGTETSVVMLNHTNLDLSGFRPKKVTPGGKGKNYLFSIRVEFSVRNEINASPDIDPEEDQVGVKVGLHVSKNKTAIPKRTGEFSVYIADYGNYTPGDVSRGELIEFMEDEGMLEKRGSNYYIEDTRVANGRDKMTEYLEDLSDEEIQSIKEECLQGRA